MTKTADFLATLGEFYKINGRDLPWRRPNSDGSFDPYAILVSEMMLQQTQVNRVIPKYRDFLAKFPTVTELAAAQLSEVLAEWVGLGYNRRARYLHEAAKQLVDKPEPWTLDDLVACKGIGPNTAAAVQAYAYDWPVLFIETNVRTVMIHHFFKGKQGITDKEVLDKLGQITEQVFAVQPGALHGDEARGAGEERTKPYQNTVQGVPQSATKRYAPSKSSIASFAGEQVFAVQSSRNFYWAMMDYGTYLKATVGNLNKHSKAYVKQSRFEGSRRQLRGQVIRRLKVGSTSLAELRTELADERFDDVVDGLVREKLVRLQDNLLMLYNEN